MNLLIKGQPCQAPDGCSVAAALAHAGQPSATFCGMGQCQQCQVTIDGIAHRLACMTPALDGMLIEVPS